MYSKGEVKEKCNVCEYKWHPQEKCWEKVGYPTWHYKYKQKQKAKQEVKGANQPVRRTAALVVNGGQIVFTSKKFEQLMKSITYFNQAIEAANATMDHLFGEGTLHM